LTGNVIIAISFFFDNYLNKRSLKTFGQRAVMITWFMIVV